MNKIESLIFVHASLEPVRQKFLEKLLYEHPATTEREPLLHKVGGLTLIQEEAVLHHRALELADLACGHGLAGTKPPQWDEVMDGEVYDAYQEVLYALDVAPQQQLSPALLAYIDQLPKQSSQDYQDRIAHARSEATVWPGNPLQHLTDEQVAQQSQQILVEKLEAMLFASSYAADLAQARQLAEAQGDFGHIRELLS